MPGLIAFDLPGCGVSGPAGRELRHREDLRVLPAYMHGFGVLLLQRSFEGHMSIGVLLVQGTAWILCRMARPNRELLLAGPLPISRRRVQEVGPGPCPALGPFSEHRRPGDRINEQCLEVSCFPLLVFATRFMIMSPATDSDRSRTPYTYVRQPRQAVSV